MNKILDKFTAWMIQVNQKKVHLLNIVSNIAFPLAGLYVLLKVTADYSALFAIAAVGLGIASALHHTLYKRGDWVSTAAQAADEVGMYAILLVMSASVAHIPLVIGIPIVVVLTTLAAAWYKKLDSHELIPIAAVFLAGAVFSQGFALGLATACLMGVAFISNLQGSPRYHGPLHSVWHVLAAIAMTMAFVYTV